MRRSTPLCNPLEGSEKISSHYLKIESVRGNPPGYVSRKDAVPVRGGNEAAGQVKIQRREDEQQEHLRVQEEARKQEEAARQAAMRHEEEERRQREEQERIWRFYKDVMPRLFR